MTEDAVGQLDLDVIHLVAQALPHRVDVAHLVLQVDVDDERPFGRERANVLDLAELADLTLDRHRDKVLHALRRHAGELRGHERGPDNNDRILALGKIGVERQADREQAGHDRDGESRARETEPRQEVQGRLLLDWKQLHLLLIDEVRDPG